jgi:predicted ATP-dependent endonuclease of OLD family
MRFTKFEFSNFRGIRSAKLDFSKSPSQVVHILVGLNESGKTTILEAIDHFRTNPDLKRRDPNSRIRTDADCQAMIPIAKRSRFDGIVRIKGTVSIAPEELEGIKQAVMAGTGFVELLITPIFTIDHNTTFVDSKRVKTNNTWSIKFQARKRRGGTPLKELEGDAWLKAVGIVEKLLPKVMYFPSHLLEFPDQISLEESPAKKTQPTPSTNSFYYAVLEDVLKAIDPKLSIESHLLKRLRSDKPADQANAQALVQNVEAHLNKTVLGSWKEIFNQSMTGKQLRFVVTLGADGIYRAEIKLSDGKGLFSLNERSAGFRWFFAFLMLVKYRAHRNDQVLFLFDEPAANLHPRAQIQLLDIFAKLSGNHQFIYTTHSHYLINPLWLESTHVVKNEALAPNVAMIDAEPSETSITTLPYRSFVGAHDDQQFYYKPILDALEYTPSKLDPSKASALVEGKTDYYCLEYFRKFHFPGLSSVSLFPGGGSGSLDALIRLLIGWAMPFVVILDADGAGTKEEARYKEQFESLVEGRISTLGKLAGAGGKFMIENMFSPADKELLRKTFFKDEARFTKKMLHRAIQELLATQNAFGFSKETLDRFEAVLRALQKAYDDVARDKKDVVLKLA